MSSRPRFFPNDTSTLLKEPNPKQHMINAITKVIENYPPTQHFQGDHLGGIYIGPTSIAYLCLHLSKAYPDLIISSHPLSHWAAAYLSVSKGPYHESLGSAGVTNEEIAAVCVGVAVKQDAAAIAAFKAALPKAVEADDGIPTEWCFGLAGTLVLLRLVAKWAPELREEVRPAQQTVISRILARGPVWRYHGRQNLGVGHGEIGILTQIVLTDPKRAKELESKLADLLDRQLPDGNWLWTVESQERRDLVHWCHGAPGYVMSLMAIRQYFPDLQGKIDVAIERGRACIWEKGVLTKEPVRLLPP